MRKFDFESAKRDFAKDRAAYLREEIKKIYRNIKQLQQEKDKYAKELAELPKV